LKTDSNRDAQNDSNKDGQDSQDKNFNILSIPVCCIVSL
jgi:hypothetical protein